MMSTLYSAFILFCASYSSLGCKIVFFIGVALSPERTHQGSVVCGLWFNASLDLTTFSNVFVPEDTSTFFFLLF